jgi:hypothetical protein
MIVLAWCNPITKEEPMCENVVATVCSGVVLLAASLAAGVNVDFETPGVLASDFNQTYNRHAPSGYWTQSVDGGVGGSGGVTVNDAHTMLYTPTSFDLSTGALATASIFFKTAGSFAGYPQALTLGFLSDTGADYATHASTAYIASRVWIVTSSTGATSLQTYVKDAGGTMASMGTFASCTLAVSTWYRYTVTVQKTAAANKWTITADLDDYGTTGVSKVSDVTSFSQVTKETSLWSDAQVWVGVGCDPAGTASVDGLIAVPEPWTALLLTLGAMGLRRRVC